MASISMGDGANGITEEKPKRKVIHFADGSTMEDYDDDDETPANRKGTDSVEGTIRSTEISDSQSVPSIDPVSTTCQLVN